ncbi:kinesin family protein [Saccharata proteae CBS 121410]|uniref:Kinesin-like protein n=1 Tax=Saccharata proteae CBS 121410 TaxID=1314787 RepID=A0A9P4LYE7_9PEZI|nr:kinesin family protein [Saccharata proteae CBS 121410]
MADGASSISVAVRVRPFTIREAAQLVKTDDGPLFLGDGSLAAAPTPRLHSKGLRSVIKVIDDKCLVFDPPEDSPVQKFSRSVVPNGKRVKDQSFAFDRVFDDNTTQADVYEATAKPLLDSVLEGYNATVFAYGATGCGKTHTITGTSQAPGIIFMTMQELFEKMQELQETKVTDCTLSYLEIYNETIRDLLVPGGSKQGLMLREDANQAVSVAGLSSHHPQSVEEVMEIIVRGNEYRTMSPTEANATSSRSHAVLQINVSSKDRNAAVNEPHTMATLSIIDLAGSERASATKNRGDRLIEGANINKSLLALGSCINALCDPRKHNHVPYRNSKLTRLLKFSLGGNCKTVMIVCVSPSSAHFDETQNTLRYANRAKNIQTKVTKNVYNVNRHVKDYLKKIDEQRAMIDELTAKMKDFEGASFVKFKKQSEKKESIAKEGVARIRNAYEHCAAERLERTNMMRKLRQIERRISLISSWIAGFDTVCETREDEDPPRGLVTMRKTALGIQAELEGSRQHYHQRIAKSNWERAIDTALQTGVRQLKEVDGSDIGSDVANLTREAELLKANADREAYTSVLDQERGGDAAVVQVLLQAHFETVAILGQIISMDEEDAIKAARDMLGKLVNSCSDATSQVIKPDGGLPITEAFPPMKGGTPKRRKPVNLLGPSPARSIPAPPPLEPQAGGSSPARASPRRKKFGAAKKGVHVVQFTPKKKSPVKGLKRGVRWRDDTDDGQLAEFQATPQGFDSTPDTTSVEAAHQSLSDILTSAPQLDSSPIPAPPESSFDLMKPRSNRFQTGFLSKTRPDGSPTIPVLHTFSSDSDHSPLREMEMNKAPHRSPLHLVRSANFSADTTPNDSAGGSSSGGSDDEKSWVVDQNDVKKIRSAIKRTSTNTTATPGGVSAGNRAHRRRSPSTISKTMPAPRRVTSSSLQAERKAVKKKSNKTIQHLSITIFWANILMLNVDTILSVPLR